MQLAGVSRQRPQLAIPYGRLIRVRAPAQVVASLDKMRVTQLARHPLRVGEHQMRLVA
jgi:hypothetical protein